MAEAEQKAVAKPSHVVASIAAAAFTTGVAACVILYITSAQPLPPAPVGTVIFCVSLLLLLVLLSVWCSVPIIAACTSRKGDRDSETRV